MTQQIDSEVLRALKAAFPMSSTLDALVEATKKPAPDVLDSLDRLVRDKSARCFRPLTALGPKEPLRFEATS